MPLVLKDRVQETATANTTVSFTMSGAVTGYQSFSAIGNTNTTYYAATDTSNNWEVGIGTYSTTGPTLTRTTVLASSNSGSAVTFSGTVTVWGDFPAFAASASLATLNIQNKTGAYTVVSTDLGSIINCTANTFTVSLTAAATLGDGFQCTIWNTGAGAITIDPNASETIDGKTTIILRIGEGVQIVCDGTNWQIGNKKAMRGYAENLPSAATRPVATGSYGIAIGNGSTASNTLTVAVGASSTASGNQSTAIGYSAGATSSNATAIGTLSGGTGGAQAVTGAGAMALGGSYASGTDSFAAAITNNTNSYGAQNTSAIAMGSLAKATASKSIAMNGTNTASGSNSTAIGGDTNTASGSFSVALGGSTNTASGESSYAFGVRGQAVEVGKYAYGHTGSGTIGGNQGGMLILYAATTDATATVMRSNTNAAGTTNQLVLPNNTAFAFTGVVVARRDAASGTASAAWKIEGLIRREGTAASTTLVASTVTAISNVPAWTLALSADTTNGCLALTVTGAAATNVRWLANIQTAEILYA